MAGLREIGSAFVRLFVKKDGLSAGLKSAEQEVKQTADKMAASAADAGAKASAAAGGFFARLKDVRKTLNDTIGVVFSLIARFTALVAIIGLAAKTAQLLWKWLTSAGEAITDFEKRAGKSAEYLRQMELSARGLPGALASEQRTAAEELVEAQKRLDELLNRNPARNVSPEAQKELSRARQDVERLASNAKRIAEAARESDSSAAKEKAKKDAEEAAKITVEALADAYDPANDPILKSAEAFRKSQAEAVEFVIDLFHKRSAEATREWGQQIQTELRRASEEFNRLQANQRNQSASGDLKTMISLLKVLVDK